MRGVQQQGGAQGPEPALRQAHKRCEERYKNDMQVGWCLCAYLPIIDHHHQWQSPRKSLCASTASGFIILPPRRADRGTVGDNAAGRRLRDDALLHRHRH